ncbi:polyunsaturated fatty acid lipoxygenase ALOX8-like [Lepisosteus oculatus]|uniref:polyunsaturated fatty acid lipoxygenase ALOX8-like n=1 Tax=Lepisosteus oculatus TaxID=7918 RepID=UPI0035F50715
MVSFTCKVSVTTGKMAFAGTNDNVYITLIGTDDTSDTFNLHNWGQNLVRGTTNVYYFSCKKHLGDIVLIRLEKSPHLLGDDWFCSMVTVEFEEKTYNFPCYRWLKGKESLELREGKAKKPQEDQLDILQKHRKSELESRRTLIQWAATEENTPKHVHYERPEDLPSELQFSYTKETELDFSIFKALADLGLGGITCNRDSWESMQIYEKFFNHYKTTNISEKVQKYWKEDSFFGYQYLNGTNPILIKQCKQIPPNFPVTNDMVHEFLEKSSSLQEELEKGSIYLVDYEVLDGIETNIIDNKKQYLPAPLCLLYLDNEENLMPIAIQLEQKAGPENPIFLPSDSVCWLLAKTYVRSADFNYFELVTHLLRTHFIAELFFVATLRQLPSVHPVFKVLIPHMRYTFHINLLARNKLMSEGGVLDEACSSGGKGKSEVLQRGFSSLTYSSLCLPEDIAARGVEGIPNYHYRDDGLKLWAAINRFVEGILKNYYPADKDVLEDTELQAWIEDIFTNGFLGREQSGIPETFLTVHELTKFLTMVIFTCSVQHSAVNSGQFDYSSWMPNAPSTMTRPPPTTKQDLPFSELIHSIADKKSTLMSLAVTRMVSYSYLDKVKLGDYPEKLFTEKRPQDLILKFRSELEKIEEEINARNTSIEMKYTYMLPSVVENSVAV